MDEAFGGSLFAYRKDTKKYCHESKRKCIREENVIAIEGVHIPGDVNNLKGP